MTFEEKLLKLIEEYGSLEYQIGCRSRESYALLCNSEESELAKLKFEEIKKLLNQREQQI